MIDLDRELRAMLEEDARVAPPIPDVIETVRRTRRRQVVTVASSMAIVAVVALGSIAGATALIRASDPRVPIGPDETPSPPATVGFACPSGSTPDVPGPIDQARPEDVAWAATTFDPGSGRMLLLTADGAFWTFDACTNTWAAAPAPGAIRGGLTELVYDIDADVAVAIDRWDVQTYDPETRTWTEKGMSPVSGAIGFSEPPQAVHDPVTGLILVRDQYTSEMWTYDLDTDTWTEVDQGATLPPVVEGNVDPPVELLTYDASVDRLILYDTKPLSTWEFDIRTGRWDRQETNTPANPGFGWLPTGEELVYDDANEVSVLFSMQTLATYDAAEHRWRLPDSHLGEGHRSYFAMTYDQANARVVVVGGGTDEVSAYDVAAGRWITLLEPSPR